MRKLWAVLGAGLVVSAGAGPAAAGLLVWSGTSDVRLGTTKPTISTGTGVATVNGSSGLGHLAAIRLAGGITGSKTTPLTDPNLPSVSTLIVNGHQGTGTLAPISGGGPLTKNTIAIAGDSKLCLLLAGCTAWLDIPLTKNGTKGLGLGGIVTVNGFGAGVRISILGAPWTIASAVVTGAYTTNAMIPPADRAATETRTLTGFVHGPTSGTSSTANVGGALQFVSATFVDTTLMTPSNHIVQLSKTMIEFVPEPGLMLLLASGVGGLALLGRHRMRR